MGKVINARLWDAFGVYSGTTGNPNDPFAFGGQYGYLSDTETAGLILCGLRYYDPSAGRWLTRDPIGYAGGINLYGYCGSNPIMRADPRGTDFRIPAIDRALSNFYNAVGEGFQDAHDAIQTRFYQNAGPVSNFIGQHDVLSAASDAAFAHPLDAALIAASAFDGVAEVLVAEKGLAIAEKAATEAVECSPYNQTAIGRMSDLAKYDNIPGIDTWIKSGRIPLAGEPPVTLMENRVWLQARIDRGDSFLLATDPANLSATKGSGLGGYFTLWELKILQWNGITPTPDY